jgi:hypothetical protein
MPERLTANVGSCANASSIRVGLHEVEQIITWNQRGVLADQLDNTCFSLLRRQSGLVG